MSLSALAIAKGGISYGALQIAALGFLQAGQPPVPPIHGAGDDWVIPYHLVHRLSRETVLREAETGIPVSEGNQRLTADLLFPKVEVAEKIGELAGEKIEDAARRAGMEAREAIERARDSSAREEAEARQRAAGAQQMEDEIILMLMSELLD